MGRTNYLLEAGPIDGLAILDQQRLVLMLLWISTNIQTTKSGTESYNSKKMNLSFLLVIV